jgi:glycosyltransferase involved in cell wall biosynthesis
MNRLLRLPKSVKVLNEYKTVEGFADLFVSATWTLIAYNPAFSQGSGLLAQSLAAGTPVLCSRFPHAKELFVKFGKLGELFTFEDIDDFQKAWLRLRHWTSKQWTEFKEARNRFRKAVSAEAAFDRVTKYLTR